MQLGEVRCYVTSPQKHRMLYYVELTFSLSRIFYFLDVSQPQKMEYLCHLNDRHHPLLYPDTSLPPDLTFRYQNPILNDGEYHRVNTIGNIGIYFYAFQNTGASKISEDDLELNIHEKLSPLEALLPAQYVGRNFSPFDVPWKFIAINDVYLMIDQGKQEEREEILANVSEEVKSEIVPHLRTLHSSPLPSSPFLSSSQGICRYQLNGQEPLRNERFLKWREDNLPEEEYVIRADQASKIPVRYSRFSRSREDFSFCKRKLIPDSDLNAAAISANNMTYELT